MAAQPNSNAASDALGKQTQGENQSLLAHYKARIDNFEAERTELLNSIDLIKVQHEEAHRLRWELRAREEEVRRALESCMQNDNTFFIRFWNSSAD